MPSILQLQPLDIDDTAETVFLGGATFVPVSPEEFRTTLGDITIRFLGTGLTLDEDGNLTAGKLEEFRVYQGPVEIDNQLVIVSSNFTLLTRTEFNAAMGLWRAGDVAAAVTIVADSWGAEFYNHDNYAGGIWAGTNGDNSLFGSVAIDIVSGLDGNDTIVLYGGDDNGLGGLGDDWIDGYEGNDTLDGGEGSDTLFGDDEDDLLDGGAAADYLNGGHGNNSVFGRSGDDEVLGGRNDDSLSGGTGNDSLSDIGGANTISGGTGNDTLSGGRSLDRLSGDDGDDLLSGNRNADVLFGGDGFDTLSGGQGNDSLDGGRGDDSLDGGSGDDELGGDQGRNTLRGNSGADVLIAGYGRDSLYGGGDADLFVFEASGGNAVIFDLDDGQDQILLRGFDLADTAAALAAATEDNGDVVFTLGSQTLRVVGYTLPEIGDEVLVSF